MGLRGGVSFAVPVYLGAHWLETTGERSLGGGDGRSTQSLSLRGPELGYELHLGRVFLRPSASLGFADGHEFVGWEDYATRRLSGRFVSAGLAGGIDFGPADALRLGFEVRYLDLLPGDASASTGLHGLVVAGFAPRGPSAGPSDLRLSLGVSGGLGGELQPHGDGPATDLALAHGAQVGLDLPVWTWVGLGGEVRFTWTRLDEAGASERILLYDLVAKPRVRWPVTHAFELHAALPAGLTIVGREAGPLHGDTKGWTWGVGGGATWFATPTLGVAAEAEWSNHAIGFGEDWNRFDLAQLRLATNLVLRPGAGAP